MGSNLRKAQEVNGMKYRKNFFVKKALDQRNARTVSSESNLMEVQKLGGTRGVLKLYMLMICRALQNLYAKRFNVWICVDVIYFRKRKMAGSVLRVLKQNSDMNVKLVCLKCVIFPNQYWREMQERRLEGIDFEREAVGRLELEISEYCNQKHAV